MKYAVSTALMLAVALCLLLSPGQAQEKKYKGTLPANWKKLNLSNEQMAKVYDIRKEAKVKVMDLQKQIDTIKTKEKADMFAVLTAEQKTKLTKILSGEPADEPRKDKVPPKDK